MSTPATSSDIFNSTNQSNLLRQYDDLMASQCQQTADISAQINASSNLSTSQHQGASKQLYDTSSHTNRDIYQSKDFLSNAADRHTVSLRDAIERNADQSKAYTSQNGVAIEKVGSASIRATELAGAQVASAVERNGLNIAERANAIAMENRIVSDNKTSDIRDSISDSKLYNSMQHNDLAKDIHHNRHDFAKELHHNRHDFAKEINHNRYDNLKHAFDAREHNNHNYINSVRDREHHYQSTQKQISELDAKTSASAAKGVYKMAKMQNVLQLQASENAAKAALDLCKTEHSLSLKASDNFAAIQLEALRNKCDLSKQLEECCCELKEKVQSSESKVSELFCQTENNRLRDSIQALQTQNLIFQSSSRPGNGGH